MDKLPIVVLAVLTVLMAITFYIILKYTALVSTHQLLACYVIEPDNVTLCT